MQPFKIWCETEKEKKAVLRKMERMGIMWCDGGVPTLYMDDPVYKAPIVLFVDEDSRLSWSRRSRRQFFKDRSYQPKSAREFLCEQEKIIIYRDGQKVIALDKRTGEKAEARCNPSDPFDFNIGARIAFDRLISEKNPVEPEQKGFTGEAVYIGGKLTNQCFTIGKIYEFIDGKVKDDFGDFCPYGNNKNYKFGVTHEMANWHFLPIVE
jgi:hypothetical protein